MAADESDACALSELEYIRQGTAAKACPEASLVTSHRSLVRYNIRLTEYKQMTASFQFPEGYPEERLLVELKSKYISSSFLSSLVEVCDRHLKQFRGEKQVQPALEFIVQFLRDNPFVVCPDELTHIKKRLCRDGDEVKTKPKLGTIDYRAQQGRYCLDFRLSIPNEYPSVQVNVSVRESNFPPEILEVVKGQAVDLARRCVQPPAMKKKDDPPFKPSPSLEKVASFLVEDCVRRYPEEVCPLCNERGLPEDPKDIIRDPQHPKYIIRVYCGHLYHYSCLDKYMKTPPFQATTTTDTSSIDPFICTAETPMRWPGLCD